MSFACLIFFVGLYLDELKRKAELPFSTWWESGRDNEVSYSWPTNTVPSWTLWGLFYITPHSQVFALWEAKKKIFAMGLTHLNSRNNKPRQLLF
jgi:hypothetical protein